MKRITITLIFALIGFLVQAQPFGTITDGEAGSSVRSTLNSALSYLDGLGLDFEFSADATSWHYGWQTGDNYIRYSDDFGSTWSNEVYLWDGAGFENLTVDTLTLNGDAITSFVGAGLDSLSVTDDNYLKWWDNGTALDSLLLAGEKYVYSITLPSSTTIAGRIAGAIDVPSGWTLSEGANSANLDIQHNLGRRVANVSVTYLLSGTEYKALVPFNNAYSTWSTQDTNNLRIEGLTTIQKTIQIFITFE